MIGHKLLMVVFLLLLVFNVTYSDRHWLSKSNNLRTQPRRESLILLCKRYRNHENGHQGVNNNMVFIWIPLQFLTFQ